MTANLYLEKRTRAEINEVINSVSPEERARFIDVLRFLTAPLCPKCKSSLDGSICMKCVVDRDSYVTLLGFVADLLKTSAGL